MRGQIEVVDYDPAWPALFDAEAAALRLAFGAALTSLEHIGSTSVPGLAAKPVIDIQAVVRSVAEMPSVSPRLVGLGWTEGVFAPDPERHRYFKKYDRSGAHIRHLHVYEAAHPSRTAHLLFRDYLRAHPDEAGRYQALKRALAARFPEDSLGYNAAKTEYIEGVLAEARERNLSSREATE